MAEGVDGAVGVDWIDEAVLVDIISKSFRILYMRKRTWHIISSILEKHN